MKRNIILWLMILGLIMGSSGCATMPSNSSEETGGTQNRALLVSGELKFNDVPIPAGFKVVQDESYLFQNDALRVGLLKYYGRARRPELVSFYKEQMPLYNWSMINMFDYEKSVLNFEKGNEICTITLEGTMRAMLVVSLSPRQNAPAARVVAPAATQGTQ